jgi:hypothetical protein
MILFFEFDKSGCKINVATLNYQIYSSFAGPVSHLLTIPKQRPAQKLPLWGIATVM